VNEQAGIYAGDEGYDINVNKHTDLKGALITSTQKAEEDGKNHFSTSSLTHSDIENHSNYSGSSFGVSGSVSANFETPFGENGAAQSTKQATDKDGNLLYTDKNGNTTVNSKGVDGKENTKKLAEGKESLQFSYGMGYGKDSDSQSSTTKSGINTQNITIKDEAEQLKRTGKTVQEEIAAIKTEITTESAQSQSGKLENRFNKDDVQKELDFQREVTEKFGPNVAEAGSLLANKFGEEAKAKRHEAAIALEEAEKTKAENNNEINQALVKQARDNFETASREAKEWETGGSQRLVIDSALNVISTALAGRPAAEVVASGLSPTVNNQIKKATTDAKGNVNTALNLTAHALWGAVEAYAGNRNVAAGAAGAAGGEAAAHFLSSTLYDKSPEKLSEEEKRTVSSLSQVAAGIAGGSLSDSSDGAIIAAKTAKDAVENNNFAALAAEGFTLVCSRTCLQALSGIAGVSIGIGLSPNEKEVAIVAAAMRDPEAMSKLTKEQVSYINEQILTDGGFVNNKELFGDKVWVPNADGGYMPVDPSLVTTTYGGKPIVDPRIFVNHTGGIEYPADYNLPTNTGGNQILNNDKGSHILVGGESQVGDWKDGVMVRDNRLPIPEPIKANNGLTIESNSKHTLGGMGNRPNAGIEPKDSLKLFESSIEGGKKRYALDDEGRIHQFNSNKEGSVWHWAGRTGKDQAPAQRINPSDITKDVYERLGTHYNEVRKR
jgi:hemagglutinin/hemolysin-related protein